MNKHSYHVLALTLTAGLLALGVAHAEQYPVMNAVADKLIQKYQHATCEQLWQERGQPKPEKAEEAVQILRSNPQMRAAFLKKVAAPIANKMFECGMIP